MLTAIEAEATRTLAEMRAMVRVLREDGETDGREDGRGSGRGDGRGDERAAYSPLPGVGEPVSYTHLTLPTNREV